MSWDGEMCTVTVDVSCACHTLALSGPVLTSHKPATGSWDTTSFQGGVQMAARRIRPVGTD